MTLAHALTPLPHTRACVPSPTGFVVELPLPRLRFPQSNISDRRVVLGDIPSAFCDPIVRGGESPLLLLPLAFVLCPKRGRGWGRPALGPAQPRQDVRKIFSKRGRAMRRKAGAGPHRVPGFVAAFFFFFPPFLIFLAVGPSSQEGDTGLSYPPAARVGVASPRPPWLGWPPASEPAQRLPFLLPRGPRPLPGVLRPALASRLAQGRRRGPGSWVVRHWEGQRSWGRAGSQLGVCFLGQV